MKKMFFSILIVLMVSGVIWAEVKIGVVNLQVVLQNTVKGRQVAEKMNSAMQQKQKRFEEMKKEIDQLEKEVTSPALNQAAKEKKAYDLQVKKTELQRFGEDAQRELQVMSQRELEPIQKELLAVIDKIAKEDGYTLIFNSTTSGFAYLDQNSVINISDKVAKAYDAQSGAKTPKQPAKK